MAVTQLSYQVAYNNMWSRCFIKGNIIKSNVYPPPLEIVTSKKKTAKYIGEGSYKDLLDKGTLIGGMMKTFTQYNGKSKIIMPTNYKMLIFDLLNKEYISREFKGELPYPAGVVMLDHLFIHEFCHYVHDYTRYQELLYLHQTDDILVRNDAITNKYNELYHEFHNISGTITDERRTEALTMSILRDLFMDTRDYDDNGFEHLVPTLDSRYNKWRGKIVGLNYGIHENELNIVWAMCRYYELNYLLTYVYMAPGTTEYQNAFNEIREIIKYIRTYSFENDDFVEFV